VKERPAPSRTGRDTDAVFRAVRDFRRRDPADCDLKEKRLMKIPNLTFFTGAALVAFAVNASAKTLSVGQLPGPVQNVIQTETKNGPVNQVESLNRNGKTVYQIGFKGASGEKYIYLNPDGTYYEETTPAPSGANGPAHLASKGMLDVNLNQLPEQVKRVVQSETTANGPAQKIQQITRNRQNYYKVTYQKNAGAKKVVWFNQDGTYLNHALPSENSTAVGAPAATSTGTRVSLSNASKVTFDKLPAAVQKTLTKFVNQNSIEDIDRGTLNGQTVYEAAFKQNGQTVELRVDENGKVIKDAQDQAIRRERK
jgi:uncharacterized membrane protein YkoI